MLKTIYKRDGTAQPYSPSKVNNWSVWACKDLGTRVDWSSVVISAIKKAGEEISSQDLQMLLVRECVAKANYAYNLMGGALYAVYRRKKLYGDKIPSVKELHDKLVDVGLMYKLNYTDREYDKINNVINHDNDFKLAFFQHQQINNKYALQNRREEVEYETPQFTYMRAAMALAEDESPDNRLFHLRNYYKFLSEGKINLPTPGFVNLGTIHKGFISCCVYTIDDHAKSIAIGDFIANQMTCMSAGLGNNLMVRSINDPVRNGMITHQGKMPYYTSMAAAAGANKQAGRGGALSSYYTAFDPECSTITMAQNPRTAYEKRNRKMFFGIQYNKFFLDKAAKGENVFTFNIFTAPKLTELFYSSDLEGFREEYERLEKDDTFKKNYVSAREITAQAQQQALEVGTHFIMNVDEANRHTPYKEPIYSTNLCTEIFQPTKPYEEIIDLYSTEDHGRGEIAICALAGVTPSECDLDEEYEEACFYAVKMATQTLEKSEFPFPHLELCAKSRRAVGIGIVGLAHYMAKKGLHFCTQEGRNELHRLAEKHMFYLIKASLRLSKEIGNAPWIEKTKWPEGWLPIDTYNKNVDELVTVGLEQDWEGLRKEIIANGGIAHSCLVAHAPTESSSKASGKPNGILPIRDYVMKKTDMNNTVDWCATDEDILKDAYDIAWNLPASELSKDFAILQKFADQGLSIEIYKDRVKNTNIGVKELLIDAFVLHKYGAKSRYYINSKVGDTSERDLINPEIKSSVKTTVVLDASVLGKNVDIDVSSAKSFGTDSTQQVDCSDSCGI